MKKGWEIKKLGEVCQLINGRAYNKQELLSKGKYTVLRVGNFFTNDKWYYSDLELDKDKYCDTGDLLYAWSASFGPKIWGGGKVIYHYHIWKVVPNTELVTKEYLYHLLDWDKEQIKVDQGAGTTMTHVSKGSMEDRLVPIPPLPEQQRIVSLLDETFAALAQVHANAERNLVNAREVFEAELREIFTNNVWEVKPLEECFRLKSGDGLTSKMMNPEGAFPVFGGNGVAGFHNEFNLSGSNVIIGRVGALCRNARHITEKIWLTDNAFKIVDFKYSFDHLFLTYLLNYKNLRSYARQAAQPVISNSSLKDVLLPIPPLEEQRAIVERLDALAGETRRLEAVYQSKLEAVEELRKSVLGKAFEGEL
jgi:type I restriction enzyme S subunit